MKYEVSEALRFTPAELMAVRLLELNLVAANASKVGVGVLHARKVQEAIVDVANAAERPDVADVLNGGGVMFSKSQAALELLRSDVRQEMIPFIGLEAFTLATTGGAKKWVVDRETLLSSALQRLEGSPEGASEAIRRYGKAVRRLSSSTVSLGLRLALLGGTVVLTVASGGIATAAGTFVGTTFMGLSGAAATSAGLAFLGGGSLAAGGFGMAGGSLLVAAVAKTGYLGARTIAVSLARESAAALVVELAKLDVTVSLVPEMLEPSLHGLRDLDAELEMSPESKEVTKSQRAVKAEIRYLTDSERQKVARVVHGVFPLPGVDRLIDGMG